MGGVAVDEDTRTAGALAIFTDRVDAEIGAGAAVVGDGAGEVGAGAEAKDQPGETDRKDQPIAHRKTGDQSNRNECKCGERHRGLIDEQAARIHRQQRGRGSDPEALPQRKGCSIGPQRHEQRGGDDQQRIFVEPVEHRRRNQRAEQTADHSAYRHAEIEFGEPRRAWPQPIHVMVQRDRGGEDDQQIARDHQPQIGDDPAPRRRTSDEQHKREKVGDYGRDATLVGESEAEAQQIETERDNPDQRNCQYVGGDVGRRREDQARGDGS